MVEPRMFITSNNSNLFPFSFAPYVFEIDLAHHNVHSIIAQWHRMM